MLKKTFIISFVFLSIIICLFFINLLIITNKDFEKFNKYQKKSFEIKANSAYQERKNVRKDLFLVDNQTRKHYIISSDVSEFFLNKKNKSYELIENLDKLTLLCFEKFDKQSNLQHIKYITAQKGYYFFPSHNLELKNVNLAFINANSLENLNLNNAYFSGHAKEMNLTIRKKKPIIEASAFNGLFNPKKGLKCQN